MFTRGSVEHVSAERRRQEFFADSIGVQRKKSCLDDFKTGNRARAVSVRHMSPMKPSSWVMTVLQDS